MEGGVNHNSGGGGGGGGGVTVVGPDAPSEYHITPRTAENTSLVAGSTAPVEGSAVVSPPPGMGAAAGKKKRGRPRKYGPDGTPNPLSPKPISLSAPRQQVIDFSSEKRGKVKPQGSGSKQQSYKMDGGHIGESVACTVGANFTPHMINVNAGEDVTMKIISFSQQGPRAICILSANGVISSVTLRQPDSSGGTLTYEGRFEILSLSGSFMPSEVAGTRSRSGGMSISLASPDGRVLGGGVAGLLVAASPVQVVVGSFLTGNQHEQNPKKQKPDYIVTSTTTAAVPISSVKVDGVYASQGQHNSAPPKQNLTSSSSFRGDNWSSLPLDSRSQPTDINVSVPGG